MTVSVTEKMESRRYRVSRDGRTSSLDLEFTAVGSSSEVEVYTAVAGAAPPVWGSIWAPPIMYRQSVTVSPIDQTVWVGNVHYDGSFEEAPSGPEASFEFDTTGGTQHITQSIATTSYTALGVTSSDVKGAIGLGDNGVEGIDIVVPMLSFSETHYLSEITTELKVSTAQATGRVNEFEFRGFPAESVLFLGATGRREPNRSSTPWSVTYRFAVQLPRLEFPVSKIDVAVKHGWDAMTIQYAAQVDPGATRLVRVPVQVDVHRVYYTDPFDFIP